MKYEGYRAKLSSGEIEIDGTKYIYDSMTIISRLWDEKYEKTQDIIIDLHNLQLHPDLIVGIKETVEKDMKGTDILFKINGNYYKYSAILQECVRLCEPGHREYRLGKCFRNPPIFLYDVKFRIGLTGKHIDRGLHEQVKLAGNGEYIV